MSQKEAQPAGETRRSDASDAAAPARAARPDDAAAAASPRKSDQPLLIVGIGASAGGLEAFKSFFAQMPADNGMAFVVVQHLAPNHASMLSELVGRSTPMPVTDAADGEPVQAGHVYVIPPDATLTIADGALQVSKPAPPRQHRWPINTFFSSLAQDQGDCAVCIVLSGTGSDGARGLREVKERGGLTLAQSGFDHAAMTGMPASAAATGLVDHILPVEEMPARLLAHQQHLQVTDSQKGPDGERQDLSAHLRTICGLLRAEVGHDFSQYKEKTLTRRIQRRMHVVQAESVPDYIAYLREHPDEHQQLFREVLIGVTEFFRDPNAFEALQSTAIPTLLGDKGAADTLRVWVGGCATGEEAYSIAIALKEAMDRRGKNNGGAPKVQIFATDIDDYAITAARAGRYKAPLTGVSPERQERWFSRDGDDWCVTKAIREMCVFSPHSAIKDPPFSRMDLVSCRNLLIYLNGDLQQRLLGTFHYALQPGGYLLLGSSEGLGSSAKLFTVVDKSPRLYQRRKDSGAGRPALPTARSAGDGNPRPARSAMAPGAEDAIERGVRHALEPYVPACVVIDGSHDILRFSGDTGRYLGPASGAASLNLFALLHRGLRVAARTAVKQALADGKPIVQGGLSVIVGGQRQRLRLIATPLPDSEAGKRLCVLAFDELECGPAEADIDTAADSGADAASRAAVQGLERELASTRAELQATVEQRATVDEEMKSANEEYQSVNEELQSANEELETSKEEMQSINEELQTVNAEMHSKNETLAHLNSDLQNLLDSTQIATLFLDTQLRVRNFTPAIVEVYHLRAGDLGRPLNEIAARIDYPDLRRDVSQVLRTLATVERDLQASDKGVAFQLRIRPYRTLDNVIDGVVLTFVDITGRQQHKLERGRLAAIVDSSRDMIIGHALDGTITSWNASAERILGYPAADVTGKSIALLAPGKSDGQGHELLQACAQHRQPTEMEMQWLRRDGSQLQVAVICSPVTDAEGKVIAGSLIARDNSERRRTEQHTQLLLGELNHRVKNTLASVQAIALQTAANSSDLEVFRDTFLARLQALSNTHNLLARDAWNGVDLGQIVDGELAPYERQGEGRIELGGGALQLTPKTALALSMAVHELATNAAKYGALSEAHGRVAVQWKTRTAHGQAVLHLRWTERDGPPVAPPTHRGFGSRLISDGLAFELDGKVALEFEPAGVVCRIDVPLAEAPGS